MPFSSLSAISRATSVWESEKVMQRRVILPKGKFLSIIKVSRGIALPHRFSDTKKARIVGQG